MTQGADPAEEINEKQEQRLEQLEDYYNGLSICVDSDTDFIQILQNSWNV